jgi:hypothetical protein
MSSEESLHIEAYDWTFKKPRIFIIGEIDDALRIFQRIQQDLLFRGRKVLVLTGQGIPKNSNRIKLFLQTWDFIIHIRSQVDYSLTASYLQNVPKPITILWVGSEIPNVFLQKYEKDFYWLCWQDNLPSFSDFFSYIFISPTISPFKYKEWFVSQNISGSSGILSNLEDLREKKAGLVVYVKEKICKWYDAVELEEKDDELSLKDIRDAITWCVDQLQYLE